MLYTTSIMSIIWGHLYNIFAHINKLWKEVLDVIMPLRAHTMRIKKITTRNVSPVPRVFHLLHNDVTTLLSYQNNHVKDIILALKHERSERAAQICAHIVADYLIEEISALRVFSPRPILIMPVPLHESRMRERGFNQMERVLERLPLRLRDGTGATLIHDGLIRTRATLAQARLPRATRLTNMRNAFAVRDVSRVKGSHVFLIDDVTTTGATLEAAALPLRKAKATVTCIALARA